MCGIFGQFTPQSTADPAIVHAMAQQLAHRGPDGYDIYATPTLAFGAGRLAIIDLTAPSGPMANEDGSVVVVFNGEIYNYRDLRQQLIERGHVFRTATDTETLVHAYEEWGDAFLSRLNGMFAFCIYDAQHQRLLLARDRLGEKPLAYWRGPQGEFVFASETKALFQHPHIRPRLNHDALGLYFALGYTPVPQTLFSGIDKLGAGEYAIVTRDGFHVQRYWQAQMQAISTLAYGDAVHETRRLVQEAVTSRMVSDVPIGAFLSGGVDSSSVVALMQRATQHAPNTFAVGYDLPPESRFNTDTRYAQQVADHVGTQHRTLWLPDAAARDLLPQLVYHLDEPLGQHSILQTAYLAGVAHLHHIPVLLTGDAGDELFLGYAHYQADQQIAPLLALPRPLRRLIALALQQAGRGNYAAKLLNDAPHQRYLEWMRILREDEVGSLLQAPLAEDTLADLMRPLLAAPQTAHFADRIAYLSLNWWIPEDSNMRVDKMCMAMSVESRAPLEDHRLVEWALSLPLSYKLRAGDTKRVFKDAMRDALPAAILSRPKVGFNPPASDWLRTIYRPLLERFLAPSYVAEVGIFNPAMVTRLLEEHLSKRGYHLRPLWALLMFHLWHALFIDGSYTRADITPLDIVRQYQPTR